MKQQTLRARNHSYFTIGNTKTIKGRKRGYKTIILHFLPHKMNTTGINVCPNATKECIESCLNDSGRYRIFKAIKAARLRKTDEFLAQRALTTSKLAEEIQFYINQTEREGLDLCVRLNGTSDLNWAKQKTTEGNTLFQTFPGLQFYDYTKSLSIALGSLKIPNYDITFSYSGENTADCVKLLALGFNIAVAIQNVKKNDTMGGNFLEHDIIDGDVDDLRFLDSKGKIVGLRVKGIEQKKRTNSFLVSIESIKRKVA
jgi:hypothetical protein